MSIEYTDAFEVLVLLGYHRATVFLGNLHYQNQVILKKSNYKGSYFNRREWLRDQRALLIVTMIVIFPIGI